MSTMSSIGRLLAEALEGIERAGSLTELDELRVKWLGRKGVLTGLLRELGSLPPEQRPEAGQHINAAKQSVEEALQRRRTALENARLEAELGRDHLDVTLPGRGSRRGSLHPVTISLRRITRILGRAGFEVHTGPQVEDDYHNFTALNIPEDHPARAMHDTFYLRSGLLLRTHTSPVQIRTMQQQGVPIRAMAPGRVYRRDSDLTHTPMFTQVEGLVVGDGVSFANLKSLLYEFVSNFFERDVRLRFRPSYFPFTEPSAEVDVLSSSGRWLEILGCGMVHPAVLRNVGVDPEMYSGYAFGMGVERLTMLRYGIEDLRMFFDNDLRFLSQFR